MKIHYHKQITTNLFLAFLPSGDSSLSCGVAVVQKLESGEESILTPPIFIPDYLQEVPFVDKFGSMQFYHLRCEKALWSKRFSDELFHEFVNNCWPEYGFFNSIEGSYLFSVDFSEFVRFELGFNSIITEESGYLIGRIGSLGFYGYIKRSIDESISIIPIKYKKIVVGKKLYVGAYDGESWDIYDNFNFEKSCCHYRSETDFGDIELDNYLYRKTYYCTLRNNEDNATGQLFLRRALIKKAPDIMTEADEPFPLTPSGKINMIGFPRDSDGDNVYESVSRLNIPEPLWPLYYGASYYVVSQNGKVGLWRTSPIHRQINTFRRGNKEMIFDGYGERILPCRYLDIVPNIEDYKGFHKYTACNSFSMLSETGWGVFEGDSRRTLLSPVFDEPPLVVIGPKGFICKFKGKYGLIDEDGNLFLSCIYDDIHIANIKVDEIWDADEQGCRDRLIGLVYNSTVECCLDGGISTYTFSFKWNR